MRVLLANIHKLPSLVDLRVDQNSLTDQGLTLMPTLKLGFLTHLDLSKCLNISVSNRIGSRGIKLLIKAELPSL